MLKDTRNFAMSRRNYLLCNGEKMTATLRTKLSLKIKTANVNMDCDIQKGVPLKNVVRDIVRFYINDIDELKFIREAINTKIQESDRLK